MRTCVLIFLVILLPFLSYCQSDSVHVDSVVELRARPAERETAKNRLAVPDTNANNTDTLELVIPVKANEDTTYNKLLRHPYLPGTANPLHLVIEERARAAKDQLFYVIAALMLFIAFVKLAFPKFFKNIFRLFFQPSFRQKQTRDQLSQNNLPAFLLNLFFIFSGGAYIALLLQHFQLAQIEFLWTFLYAISSLAVLYVSKYIFLTFSGWVFNVKEATDTYIFVVYLINKIIGIVLIPFILILAFSYIRLAGVGITISVLLLFLLFVYRYFISFTPVTSSIKVSPLHFFFYICAFEITPLLLIYKLLTLYLHRTL